MSQITITSNNFSGYTGDITFYPFSGGSISYGSQTIPYTFETENFIGEYNIQLDFSGVEVNCGFQIGSSPCVYITTNGATSDDYSGLYEYVGQGYIQYSSKSPDNYQVVCSDTDPKSKSLYILKIGSGLSISTYFMGNVYESFFGTQQISIIKFINYNVAGNPCGQSWNWPATYVSYPTYSSNGFPLEGNYTSGISGQGTYLLENIPNCIAPSPTPTPTSSITPTPSITPTITPTPSITPSITPSNTPSITPSISQTPSPTITPTMTPTPSSSSPPPPDPDALAYLADVVASGGTTNPTIEAAVDTLFKELKNNGLYSKIEVMYPYVGGTAGSHAINAHLNKTYDIDWYGGWVFSSSGSTPNGIDTYGDTHFIPTTADTYNWTSGIYLSTFAATSNFDDDYGVWLENSITSVGLYRVFNSYWNNGGTYAIGVGSTQIAGINPSTNGGNTIITRSSSNNTTFYINGVLNGIGSFSVDNTYDNQLYPIYLGTTNYNGSFGGFGSNKNQCFFFICNQVLSPTEIPILDNIINTFQTSLGRNRY